MTHYTRTDNGALSHLPDSDCMALFARVTRATDLDQLQLWLRGAWEEDPLLALKLVFFTRNCRGGKGERKQGICCLQWLADFAPHTFRRNIEFLPRFGYFKDMLNFLTTNRVVEPGSIEEHVISVFCKQLKADFVTYRKGKCHYHSISLAAKWAPSQKGHHDKKFHAASKFADALNISPRIYRKALSEVRQYLNIVERQICAGEFDDIVYSKLPSIALHRYAKLFQKHSPERYAEFLSKVKGGDSKMNTGQLQPHQIVQHYLTDVTCYSCTVQMAPINDDIEVRWNQYLVQLKAKVGGKTILPMIDVSGSMTRGQGKIRPIDVAVSLGLTLAHLAKGQWHNKWLTFAGKPQLVSIRGSTLAEQIYNMQRDGHDWGLNTNYALAMDLLLTIIVEYGLTQADVPAAVVIVTDMQFDTINYRARGREATNDQAIIDKWHTMGLTPPKRIYMNVAAANVDFPVTSSTFDTALISGYEPLLMKLLVDDEDITPRKIMENALNDECYDVLQVAVEDLA